MSSFSRGRFIAGVAALGAGAAAPLAATAQAPRRIDIHHHCSPPTWVSMFRSQLEPFVRDWSPQRSLEDMDRAGVATAMVSVPGRAGISAGSVPATRRLVRACNEYMAELARRYPGRFGTYAALPLPDVEGSLTEIAYALDTLQLDGIGLFTSYGKLYLGDPAFAPVFDELNRRKAIVFTHPLYASCCTDLVPNVPQPIIEYGTDTTRTIASLVFNGTAARCPDVRFIFSHAGGTMPFLIERFANYAKTPAMASKFPDGVLPVLKRFFYDTAQSSNPIAMGALAKLVPISQIVLGSDFPYRTEIDHVSGLAGCGFSADQIAAIERGNALRMIPRLARA